ncbi:unnamed protein product [Linum tenue]|uniref:Homeobox-leucine zipper protein n=1 Tax=Linum tenue TaxID=586396 RepID=A0AAV0KE33_9ROSI|nr:unnamed protein product [Linum tenue]
MSLISQLYPTAAAAAAAVDSSQLLPQQGSSSSLPRHQEKVKPAPRRRRKKNKDGSGSSSASGWPKKRKLSDEQVTMLELSFGNEHKLESDRKDRLAAELGLDPRQVAVWFQNRRARWKNKKLEEEYSKLKAAHDRNVLDKCRLESEVVLKLKVQLSEAEKEVQRLSDVAAGSNSPSSSMTMEAKEYPPSSAPAFFEDGGAFGVVESYEDVFYNMAPEATYVVNGMEWMYM